MNKKLTLSAGICLVVIFLIAGFLRLWKLPEQGLFFYDEAWYRLVAETYLKLPQWYGLIQSGLSGKEAFEQVYSWGFYPQISYKPSYILLLMLAGLIGGVANPVAGAYLSVILGLGIVGAVYLVLMRFMGKRWLALAGALIAAVSGMEVSYSRMTFPHQLAALSLLLYIWLYLKRLDAPAINLRLQYVLGVGIGFLLTTHDLMLPIVATLTLFELGVILYQYRLQATSMVRMGLCTLGVATPIIFWQLVTILLREFFQDTLGLRYVHPYIKEVFGHVTAHKVTATHVIQNSDYLYFFKVLWQTEGALFLGVLLIGLISLLVCTCQKRDAKTLFISSITFIFTGLITLYPSKILRLVAPFFPLFIIAASLGLLCIQQGIARKQERLSFALVGALTLLMLMRPISYSYDFTKLTSGYAELSRDIKRLTAKGEKVATPYNFPVYTYYTQQKVHGFKSHRELQGLILTENVRYVIYDSEQLYRICKSQEAFCQTNSERVSLLQEEEKWPSRWVKYYPNSFKTALPLLLESHYSYDMAKDLTEQRSRISLDRIRLYRIATKEN